MNLNIPYLLQEMTLEEKAGLCSGIDFWWTKAVDRLGLSRIMMSDGPHGLRKQANRSDHLGVNESIPAVCFPSGATLASSFDRALMKQIGEHLGEEARAEHVHTVLGPAINMKRSPLCGRNFEYMSEDPYLAGELAASYIQGVQSKNVGTSVKHFAANNQELHRMSINDKVSERALREIYLTAFEIAVKKAAPWTVMCAYNQINGTYCCENSWLLKKILREEWGYQGIVMTDWGAMNDRVKALKAGLELEMPGNRGISDRELVQAVHDGTLTMAELDHAVTLLLHWIDKCLSSEPAIEKYDREAHHSFARKAAAESAVLLKNDNMLPLSPDTRTAIIGTFAASVRYQGGGSSHINAYKVTNILDAAEGLPVCYAPGWADDAVHADPDRLAEALKLAKDAEAAVIFAGLPDIIESEGYDRPDLSLPECQNALIRAVCEIQPNTTVVLQVGSPVLLPWREQPKAILLMYLGGQAVGEAAIDLIYGKENPCGHLAETFPLRLSDTPSYLNFPGDLHQVNYAEDIFIGYRWYDSRRMPVAYPFGHGLSYTEFALHDLKLSLDSRRPGEPLTASVLVTNTGNRVGKAVLQLYVSAPEDSRVIHAAQELKGFEKKELQPGETREISFSLDDRSFAYYSEEFRNWCIESGEYAIRVGLSSRDLPLTKQIKVIGTPEKLQLCDTTTVEDVLAAGKQDCIEPYYDILQHSFGTPKEGSAINNAMIDSMIHGIPLHSMGNLANLPEDYMDRIIEKLNKDC